MERYRLFNAVQTKILLDGVDFDLRSDTVEITARDDMAVLVLYRMFDLMNPNPMPDPLCVARIVIPGPPRIFKPADLDGQQWLVQTPRGGAIISPYKEDHIVTDPTFETGYAARERSMRLEHLLGERRSVQFAIMANQRYLWSTPDTMPEAKQVHQTTIDVMQGRLAQLDQMIAQVQSRLAERRAEE